MYRDYFTEVKLFKIDVILKSGAVQNELNFTSSQRLSRPVSVARI
jgi:hypothetical protein